MNSAHPGGECDQVCCIESRLLQQDQLRMVQELGNQFFTSRHRTARAKLWSFFLPEHCNLVDLLKTVHAAITTVQQ